MSAGFSVFYGSVPFTIQEYYAPEGDGKGHFIKEAGLLNHPSKLLPLDTVVVDVTVQAGQYTAFVMFSCLDALGVAELIIATRATDISDSDLAAITARAAALNVPGVDSLKRVSREKCKPSLGAAAVQPCCEGTCTAAGQAKYYSIAKDLGGQTHCGECCMDPSKYTSVPARTRVLPPAACVHILCLTHGCQLSCHRCDQTLCDAALRFASVILCAAHTGLASFTFLRGTSQRPRLRRRAQASALLRMTRLRPMGSVLYR
jgi:hypothetical protein